MTKALIGKFYVDQRFRMATSKPWIAVVAQVTADTLFLYEDGKPGNVADYDLAIVEKYFEPL